MSLTRYLGEVPSDKSFHKWAKGIYELVGFYAPLLYLAAPFSWLSALLIALTMAVFAYATWKHNFRYWLVGGMFMIILVVILQVISVYRQAGSTYYVQCNSFKLDCFWTYSTRVLGTDVTVWPYNSYLPMKERLVQLAAGEDAFNGYNVRSTIVDGEKRLQSPIELQLFKYLGGESTLGGVRIPYALDSERRTIEINTFVQYRSNHDGAFGVSLGVKTSRISAEERLELLDSLQSSNDDFSFFASGDETDHGTWNRLIRNDIWLQSMALQPIEDIVENVKDEAVELWPNEALLLESMDLFALCRSPQSPESVLGCRLRLNEVMRFRDTLPGNSEWAAGLVTPMLEAVRRNASLELGPDSMIEVGYFAPPFGATPEVENSRRTQTLTSTLILDTEELSQIPGPMEKTIAKATLERALTDAFQNTAFHVPHENASCDRPSSLGFLEAITSAPAASVDTIFSQLSVCPDTRREILEEFLLLDDQTFETELQSLLTGMSDFERRRFLVDVLAGIDRFQRAIDRRAYFNVIQTLVTVYSGDPQRILYADALEASLNSMAVELSESTTLDDRGQRILLEFEDAPSRIRSLVSASFFRDPREAARRGEALALTRAFVDAVSSLRADFPTPSGSTSTDLSRLFSSSSTNFGRSELGRLISLSISGWSPALGEVSTEIQFILECLQDVQDGVVAAILSDMSTLDVEGPAEIIEFIAALSMNCEVAADILRLFVEPTNKEFDLALGLKRLVNDFPKYAAFLRPSIENLKLRDIENDWTSAYRMALIQEIGNAALGLRMVDWERIRTNRSDEVTQTGGSNWSEPKVRASKDMICEFSGSSIELENSLINVRELWKHSATLVALARIQALCAPDTPSRIMTSLLEQYGQDVLNAVDDFRVTPLQRQLMQNDISESLSGISSSPSTKSQREAAASIALMRVTNAIRSEAIDEDKLAETDLETYMMTLLFPAQASIPIYFRAGPTYHAATEALLTHDSGVIREAVLQFLLHGDTNPKDIAIPIYGSNNELDGDEITDFVALIEVLRRTDLSAARDLVAVLIEEEIDAVTGTTVVDVLIDNDEMIDAASQILRIPYDEIPLFAKARWGRAFLTEDGRLLINSYTIYQALVHMNR